MVRAGGLEPPQALRPCGFSCRLRLSPPGHGRSRACVRFVVWTIPSPYPGTPGLRCCPSSLYTFPTNISVRAWLGITIAGFPEFGQFCIASFPACTQVALSPLRMPFRHARVPQLIAIPMIEQATGIYTCCDVPKLKAPRLRGPQPRIGREAPVFQGNSLGRVARAESGPPRERWVGLTAH